MNTPPPAPQFRPDLYQGTAPFYDRYRPPYPDALFEDLRARLPITGAGRLLDLACGTGQVAVPLAAGFVEAVAVDSEPETVAFARNKHSEGAGSGIRWLVGAAETAPVAGPFELVAVGTAFHRLDRLVVARRMREWVADDGGVVLLWSAMPSDGEQPWQQELRALITDWMDSTGSSDRLPPGWDEARAARPDREVLEQTGFTYDGRFEFPRIETWTVESLVGFLYSTSILSRVAVGGATEPFEADVTRRLTPFTEDGTFQCEAVYAYELARPAG